MSLSTDLTTPTWVDGSDEITSVSVPEQSQLFGSTHVLGDDYMHTAAAGKYGIMSVTVNALWTDTTASKPWKILFDLWDAGGQVTIGFKYSMLGGGSGATEYIAADASGTAAECVVSSLMYPSTDDSGDIARCSFTIEVPRFIDATIA